MSVSLFVNGSHDPTRTNFVSWAPSPCEIKLDAPAGAAVKVELRNERTDVGGQVVFYKARGQAATDTIQVDLPADGSAVTLLVGGKRASTENGDAAIQVVKVDDGSVLGTTRLMVRVRKNANKLTAGERDRFLGALAKLNNQGRGRFRDFREMHRGYSDPEAHGDKGFLSWHRAYLLDLERELQSFDSSVSLHYWRFDEKAENVFTPEFMGSNNTNGSVRLSSTNPLQFWRTDEMDGFARRPSFNTATQAANIPGAEPINSERRTIGIGNGYFEGFSVLDGNPHGYAHVSFNGDIDNPDTAPRDPLFFMLHANVDRLWAKWQAKYRTFDAASQQAFMDGERVGHRRGDTMWPWNGAVGDFSPGNPRPDVDPPPGGGFASSAVVDFPQSPPQVEHMLDYQGRLNAANRMDFDYDDVEFAW